MIDRSGSEPGSQDILALLERLEEVLNSGSRLPFTSRALVDDEECFAIIDQIRLNLPTEIRQARGLYAERDALLDEARARGDQIIRTAEAEARELVKDHFLTEQAQSRAQEIVADAERRAADYRAEAYDYAYEVLVDLDRRLKTVFGVVQEGIEELRPDRAESAPPPTEGDRARPSSGWDEV
jgi:vacuolar-type H+-ATPase subunit H